jgi:amino acid adenylation domain-containing protein
VQRHEALRTTFSTVDGKPVQIIQPELTLPLSLIDLSGLSETEREAQTLHLAQRAAQQPFDLARGPLLRTWLLRLSEQEHIFALTMHHVISDNWSTGILIQEVALLYDAFSNRRPLSLPKLPIQYADFAHWQRNWLQGEVLETQLDYWKGQLAGQPPLLELPTDRPRPAVQTFRGDYQSFVLSEDLSQAIEALCQREGVTLFMTLLAAFQTLLYRYSGQDDVSVGTPIANRSWAEVESLIGFFVNTLVLRTDLSGAPSFRELLERVRETALGAYAHQDVPFEMIVDVLQPQRNLSHSPLFQVMFALQSSQAQTQSLPGSALTLSAVEAHSGTAKFDLTLFMVQDGEQLGGALEYNTDLFDAPTIARMLGHFELLLAGIVADPDHPISALPLLAEAERRRMLVEWNDTAAPYPRDLCVQQLFEAQVARTPKAVAVTFVEQHLTFAALNRRANQLAHYLQKQGVGPDTLVGMCVERSLEMVVGLLGVLKAGGAYVPLDPTYPPERLAFMLQDSQAPVLLTQAQLVDRLPIQQTNGQTIQPNLVCLDADWSLVAQESDTTPTNAATPGNLAYVIYTSGSTGLPKGAMIRHQGLVNYLTWCQRAYPVQAGRGAPVHSSISFDLTVTGLFAPLLAGRRVQILPEDVGVETLSTALQQQQDYSLVKITPAHLELLSQQLAPQEAAGRTRAFIIGGENLLAESVAFWQKYAPGTLLVNEYGPTETVVGCCVYKVSPDEYRPGSVPIGQPIINTQLYILDSRLSPLPAGAIGELYIGGDGVARGYLNRPELTAAKFVPDPFGQEAGARLYKTGDLARYLPGGDIEFLGRTDHQVKVRGFRIELGEIEAVLSQHAAVQETIVLAREDTPGDKRLVAYVVTADDDGDLRGYLKDRLPEYMVPSAFVTLDALPLTTNGKVDRRALPVPDWTRPELGATFVAPRTPEEEILAGIWAGILGVERVGVYDTFFDLGGHSLLATQVISRLRDAFDVELPVRALFEAPTVAGLAASVEAARREAQGLSAPPIEPLPRDAGLELPLSFAQQRLWFLDQLEPGSPFYNLPTAVRLTGPLDVVALKQSLNEVVRRHEALRTTFASAEGRPLQVIAARMTLALPVVDLTGLEERQVEAQRLATAEARRPFDLAQGPLLRACLLRLEDSEHSEHVVLLNMHHIVSDGWSMNVLIQELAALYVAFSSGDASLQVGREGALLPELPIQYADFAHWQRNWLQGEVLGAQLAYWKEQLAGLSPLLELPTDRPRPAVQTFRGAQKTFVLPPELSTALKDLSYAENATLFMTLLAAFQTLLYRYTGQKDISVGTPIANRNRSAIEGLIGFFVNTLVMRADLTGAPSFRELLGRVREAALGAYAHQDVPFEMLVDVLQPQRDMSHSPLFQVMFVLQNTPTQAQALSSDLVLSSVEADEGTARFDLTLTMVEDARGLGGFIEYNVDLFDTVTVERLIAHFQTLLMGIVADPDLCVARLPLLTGAERQQLLATWNDTAASDARAQDQCAHELFEAQVARTPDAVAVVFDDLALTYQALNRRANQLAHHLQKLGVRAETLVGISVQRSPDMVVGLLGILKAGGVYLPLDPTYPQNRLSFMLEDAQVSILLTQAQLDPISTTQSLAPARSAGDPIPNTVRLDADWARIAQESDANPTGNVTPENLAYVIYTSGSTGRPKGALLRHRGLCNLVRAAIPTFGVGADSRVLQFASFSFDASVEEIFKTLSAGASLCLIRQETLLSPPDLLRTLREQAITTVTLPPSLLKVLPAEGLPALQTVVSAGESCSPDVVARWAPGRRFLNGYGPTEATVAVSFYRVERVSEEMTYVSIGRPLANAQIYLLDAQLQPVPVGVPGELHIGGVGLARGYLRRPGLTAAKFIPNPFSDEPGKQLYGTGDLARHRPDGRIEFLGRLDHQVKVRGFRIELGEIEALLQQHPALQAAAVLAREGDGQGPSGDKRLVAYVVPTAGQGDAAAVAGELRNFLLDSLPEYMVPAAFVMLDALPLTPNGKVDRRVLPAPDLARSELEKTFVAPRDELERQVTQIWEQVLGVQPIGVKDNFFELGGHSLLAVQLVAQIQQHTGQNVSLLALFQSPTIEHLVRVLRRQSGTAPAPSLVELQPAGQRRPFFLVHPSGGSVHWYTGLAHLVGGPPRRRVRRLLNAFGRVLRRRTAHKPPQPAEGVVRAEDSRLDQPVYGLQAQGLMGDAELHTRIEDMAAHYVQELRAVQPEGPYMLGSWSMGVIIAFEMAQQLEAQGQRVALLALLDQGPVVPGEPFPDDAAFLMRLFGEHLALSPERLRQLESDEQLAYVFEEAGKANWLPTGITLPQFSHYVRILRLHTEAWREYVPQVYPGRVTLFRTQAQPEIGSQEPDLGWGELAAGGIEIHQVSGDHHSIVHGRHVWNLAERLRACLDAAQAVD